MPWYNVKVIGVGKSSLVRRFVLGEFGEHCPRGRQIFWEKASLPCVDDDKHYNHGLIVWDGDPQTVIPPGIELGDDVIGEAVVVVYDVTNRNSFLEAEKLVRFYTRLGIPGHLYIEGPRVVVLVGSKADLWMYRKIKYKDAQTFAQKHGIPFMEVSAFTGMNVHNLFSKMGMMVQSRVLVWNRNVLLSSPLPLMEIYGIPLTISPIENLDLDVLDRTPALRSICKLDLSHSQLYGLPEAIGSLPSLTHLFLSDNHLSSLQPEIIRTLVNLQELD
ncbi:unnamed protein product, partial [Porites lobata]